MPVVADFFQDLIPLHTDMEVISLATGQVSWATVEHIISVSIRTGKEKHGSCSLKALAKHLIQGQETVEL